MDPSGCRLVAGFTTGALSVNVALWSVGSLREVQAWRPHAGPVSALAASSSGRLLASGSRDSSVFVLDVTSGPRPELRPRGMLGVPGAVCSLQWAPPSEQVRVRRF